MPGGSTRELETFSSSLLNKQYLNLASSACFSCKIFFFSSVERASLSSRCFCKCVLIRLKSNSSILVTPNSLGKRARKLLKKFLRTVSYCANSEPSSTAHQLQISSTSGFRSIGLPCNSSKMFRLTLYNNLTPCGSYPGKNNTPWCSNVFHFSF